MENINLKEKLDNTKSQIIYAKKGKFDSSNNEFLILFDGEVLNQDLNNISNFSFKETEINLSRFTTQQITDIKIQEVSSKNLILCFLQLKKFGNLITDEIRIKNNLEVNCRWSNYDVINKELVKRFLLPFYLPILSLIACLLITKSKDEFNFNKFTYLLFLLGVTIIIISELSIKYTSDNFLNNIFLTSLPIIIFIIFYFYFLIKIKTPKHV